MLVMSFARCSSRRCVSFEVPSVSAAVPLPRGFPRKYTVFSLMIRGFYHTVCRCVRELLGLQMVCTVLSISCNVVKCMTNSALSKLDSWSKYYVISCIRDCFTVMLRQ